ncbi:MAG: hypothetical protein ACJ790_21305 [Myxococcaceae bacterium]
MNKRILVGAVIAAAAIGGSFAACGSDTSQTGKGGPVSTTPANPGGTGGGGGPSSTVGNLMDLSAGGMSPQVMNVPTGAQVTFVNHDTIAHQPASDAEPANADCPELNSPVLQPGASFTATMGSTPRNCGLHDHMNPANSIFFGTITIVSPASGAGGGGGTPSGAGGGGGTTGGAGGGGGGNPNPPPPNPPPPTPPPPNPPPNPGPY